jgi:type IV secretion system protein VirB10
MSLDSQLLSPDVSPHTVSKSAGVRRVNNRPLYIVGAIMLIFMLLMMVVAINRANERSSQSEREDQNEVQSSDSFAALIAKDYTGGIIAPKEPPIAQVAEPLPEQLLVIERPADPDLSPLPPQPLLPPDPAGSFDAQQAADQEQIRQRKQQLFEEAVRAKTQVNVIAPRSAGSAPADIQAPQTRDEMLAKLAHVRQQIDAQTVDDPTSAYQLRLAQLRQDGGVGDDEDFIDDTTPRLLADDADAPVNDLARFDSNQGEARWQLNRQVNQPAARYVLQTGFVIPATLISGINSGLPGQIMAQVSQPVYDSPTGKWRLIPQGSRLVGSYSSEVAFGQARVLVAWQRIIFPDGKTMDIGAMPGADGAGYAGFKDQVNNHYARVFGSALLMSAVIAGVSLSQRDAGGAFGRQSAGSILSQSVGQQLGQATARLMNKNLNIAPTLEIRPGYRFNVIVTKDMAFSKPYQSFDY